MRRSLSLPEVPVLPPSSPFSCNGSCFLSQAVLPRDSYFVTKVAISSFPSLPPDTRPPRLLVWPPTPTPIVQKEDMGTQEEALPPLRSFQFCREMQQFGGNYFGQTPARCAVPAAVDIWFFFVASLLILCMCANAATHGTPSGEVASRCNPRHKRSLQPQL